MNLRQERREWVLAADLMPLLLNQVEPLPVVNLSIGAPVRFEYLKSYFLEPLAAQTLREVLDPQLCGQSQGGREFLQKVLVALRPLFELLGKSSQSFGLLALLHNAGTQHVVLVSQLMG
jgi:hypothetical protein